MSGDFGKPRPVLAVQSQELEGIHSLLVCPLTSDLSTSGPARVLIEPSDENGLLLPSLVMVDKLGAISLVRAREHIGKASPIVLRQVDEKLILVLGLAG